MILNESNDLPKEIKKYLQKFGLENWKLETAEDKKYKLAIVIPALCEYENIRLLLESFTRCDATYFSETLIVFVVNNLKSVEENIKSDNVKTLELLRNIIAQKSNDELINKIKNCGLQVGLVDSSSKGNELPEKDGGVGLARKIGMDLVLTKFDYNSKGKNIILCTDSDSIVEENYITEVYNQVNKKNIRAGYVRFNHPVEGDFESQKAIVCYEIFLRYYLLGLQYAKSPYAIHTIGSTMLSDAETYAKIQGMNKRKAAEDFYFMEKLAKNTKLEYIKSTGIFPSGRGSWRVPFGTGQRVNRFLSNEVDEYQLYSPENFEIVKHWLEKFNSEEIFIADEYLKFAEHIDPVLRKFLAEQNFENDWQKILDNNKNEKQINRQKVFWFDGFKTLKLIHFLRDELNPNMNMFDALDKIFERMNINSPERNEDIPELDIQIKYLEILREIA